MKFYSFPVQQSIGSDSILWIHHIKCCPGLFVFFQRFIQIK